MLVGQVSTYSLPSILLHRGFESSCPVLGNIQS
uniref:Uncharacterized protein n=1 Tax=Rhizophora mucronata TaxID=61149 RepID=A0A2P2QLZ2_RHIMU